MSKQAGLQIEGEFLDLVPGTVIDLEEQNIFLQLEEEVQGDYTLPFEAVVNEKNLRLTDYNSVINSVGMGKKDAVLWDGTIQHSRGTVKIEKLRSNLNDIKKGSISLYYLKDVSSFYSEIKDKKLTDLSYDPIVLPADGSAGLVSVRNALNLSWAVGNCDTYDYVVYPVLGDEEEHPLGGTYRHVWNYMRYTATPTGGLPNCTLEYIPGTTSTGETYFNSYTPFPYLRNVLLKIFDEAGWQLQGDILTDPDFKKITIIYFQQIIINRRDQNPTFRINEHLPPINISTFLIELSKRLGIWFDYNSSLKTATIKLRKDAISSSDRVDISNIVSPVYQRSVIDQNIIYALDEYRNENESFSLSKFNNMGSVLTESALPTPTSSIADDLYLVKSKNVYVACVTNNGTTFFWETVSQNKTGYLPAGYTKKITTKCYIPSMEIQDQTFGGVNTKYYIPYCKDEMLIRPRTYREIDIDTSTDHFYLAYYHGPQEDTNGRVYPYASPHPYTITGVKVGDDSLTFLFNDVAEERGLYHRNWKTFLDTLTQREKYTFTTYCDIVTFKNLSFGQIVVVNGVQFYLQNKKSRIPYDGIATIECSRIVS